MNVSVAMCTYNGSAYVAEQLASIAAQDIPPDEVVICDDGSEDSTVALLAEFADRAPFEVRVIRNDRQLGSSQNFARAIDRCRGRWIVLADQDDVWLPHRLRRLREAIAARPDLGLVFSNAHLVDDARQSLGYELWSALRFDRGEQRQVNTGRALDVLLRHNVVCGATAAFRADLRRDLLPIPDGWVHDGWIALVAAALAPCHAIAEPLIEYRQHGRQQIGERKRSLLENYRRARQRDQRFFAGVAANYTAARDRLAACRDRLLDPRVLRALDRKIAHFHAKARMRTGLLQRPALIAHELLQLNYLHYSTGWRSLAQDLLG